MKPGRDLVPLQGRGGALTRRLQALVPGAREAAPPTVPQELPPPQDLTQQDLTKRDLRKQDLTTQDLPPPRGLRSRRPAAVPAAYRSDADFLPSQLEIDDAPDSPIRFWVIAALVGLFAAAFAWSYFGQLASYTTAAGKIQATGRTKVLEAMSKGKVTQIRVRDGDRVKAGDILVELDPVEAQAARTIVAQKLLDARAESLRHKIEIAGARAETIDINPKINWPKDIPTPVRQREDSVARADLSKLASQLATLASQKRAKEAERDKYEKSLVAQKALVAITQENMTMIESLTKKGYNSQAKFLDYKATLDGQQVTQTSMEGSLENAKQAILTLDSEMAKTREAFVADNTQTDSQLEQSIVDLTQQLIKADQTLSFMTLTSPVSGVVHASSVTTIGQVVKPGQQLMQIVPADSPLEIQAYVVNTDIGFIRVGDPATIKVNTFTYGTYGAVDGTVTDVGTEAITTASKDSVQDASLDGQYKSTSTAQKTGNIQFPITVRAQKSFMRVDGKDVPLTPGMGVNVEIETEHRRPIDYIVSPILELFSTAGHEK